ncbi:MAG TPA: amino acid permease [Candidatus Acidoferrales bacterium]|nr:amino acid permease [Candidatus Acidoferrales bacterium]
MNIFRRKSAAALQAEAQADQSLKRALGAINLTALGIGAIIGAGIFVLTGHAAAEFAGPGIVYSFMLSGLACAFAGLCYAEFASMIPLSGSAYTYGYATLGEFVAWIIGWNLILEYLFAASTVAVGWSGYVVSFLKDLHLVIPAAFTAAPYNHVAPPGAHWWNIWDLFAHGWTSSGAVLNVPAMFIIGSVTILLIIGIKESANFNNAIVALKLTVILTFIAVGAAYINRVNWHPFVPPAVDPDHFGWGGVVRAASVIFFAYIGFDAVSTAAQECKRPQRDMPIALLGSLGICTILYILVSLVLTGVVNYTQLNVPAPIAVAISTLGPSLAWLEYFVKIGAIAGLSSVILVMMLGQPRIFYSMSKDGLLPPAFSAVHPRFRTPWLAQIITGVAAMLIAGLFPIGLLGELVSIGTLLAFAIVCAGVLVLRFTDPQINRPFRVPLVGVVAPLGVASCGYLMFHLPPDTWARLIVWIAIGVVIYVIYGYRHSKLHSGLMGKPGQNE